MQQQTETTKAKRGNGTKRPRGRKDQTTGQEAAISLRPIKDGIEELVSLYTQQQESAARCSDAIKAVAEKSGLMANVVRKFVKARAGEKFEEAKRTVEQLSLVFEDMGEA
jgi:hypothetical protein